MCYAECVHVILKEQFTQNADHINTVKLYNNGN